MEEAGVPGENYRSLRVEVVYRKHIPEKIMGSDGIRTHALTDGGLLT